MKRMLLPSLLLVLIPLCLWASYGKSNVLQKEIHRAPLIVEPVPQATPQPQAAPTTSTKGCVKKSFYPFTIHILSSQNLSDANRSLERLNATLETVFITKTDLGATGIWYRLDYGLFPVAKEAVKKMRELQQKGIIEKGAFIGGPTPYTLELALFDAQSKKQAIQEIKRLEDLGVAGYLIEDSGGCLRVAVGAFPDMKSAKMVHAELLKLGLKPSITKR